MLAVLMATYNGEKYICQAIESIMHQNYDDYCLYIHDDGSSDSTEKIIGEYEREFPDKIKVIEGKTFQHSANNNFMYMLSMVQADWYMFADQDDVWNSDKIEIMMQIAKKENENHAPVLLFSDMIVVGSDLHVISDSFMSYCSINPRRTKLNQVISENIAAGCTCLFNNSLAKQTLRLENTSSLFHHDWWLVCVASATGKIVYVDKALIKYRQHSNNEVGAKKDNYLDYVKNLFMGQQVKKSKDRTERFVRQAIELSCVDFLHERDREMINSLKDFYDYGKIKRISVFLKYGIKRSKRNIWMYLTL